MVNNKSNQPPHICLRTAQAASRIATIIAPLGLLVAAPAYATVITGTDSTGLRTGGFSLDLGLGGLIFNGSSYYNYPSFSYTTSVQTDVGTEVLFGPALDAGALIDDSGNFGAGTETLWNRWQSGYMQPYYGYSCGRYSCYSYYAGSYPVVTGAGNTGTWAADPTGFLGFRFDDDGWHYGWLELSIRDSYFDITRWAYETNAGVGIEAGSIDSMAAPQAASPDFSVPEPGTLALLALGSAGLAGFRRRQRN